MASASGLVTTSSARVFIGRLCSNTPNSLELRPCSQSHSWPDRHSESRILSGGQTFTAIPLNRQLTIELNSLRVRGGSRTYTRIDCHFGTADTDRRKDIPRDPPEPPVFNRARSSDGSFTQSNSHSVRSLRTLEAGGHQDSYHRSPREPLQFSERSFPHLYAYSPRSFGNIETGDNEDIRGGAPLRQPQQIEGRFSPGSFAPLGSHSPRPSQYEDERDTFTNGRDAREVVRNEHTMRGPVPSRGRSGADAFAAVGRSSQSIERVLGDAEHARNRPNAYERPLQYEDERDSYNTRYDHRERNAQDIVHDGFDRRALNNGNRFAPMGPRPAMGPSPSPTNVSRRCMGDTSPDRGNARHDSFLWWG